MLNLLFDSLWRRAEPVIANPKGWEPIVRLLKQGMTDEPVAQFLGLNVRTVRRSVADAMNSLGASSRFALGVAWATTAEFAGRTDLNHVRLGRLPWPSAGYS